MVVLRFMLGNTETVFLNFSESGESSFSLFFMETMGLGSCRVIRASCSLEQDADRDGPCRSDSA